MLTMKLSCDDSDSGITLYVFVQKEYQDFYAFQSVLNACIKVHLLCTYINYFAFVIKISYFKKISNYDENEHNFNKPSCAKLDIDCL